MKYYYGTCTPLKMKNKFTFVWSPNPLYFLVVTLKYFTSLSQLIIPKKLKKFKLFRVKLFISKSNRTECWIFIHGQIVTQRRPICEALSKKWCNWNILFFDEGHCISITAKNTYLGKIQLCIHTCRYFKSQQH